MSAVATHDWRLVAPWYRWDRYPGVAPRNTAPVLQKYEGTDLIDQFLANPQRALQFTKDDTVIDWSTSRPLDTNLRKLYLPTHKRFYLAVCELHCDRPGFPNASRKDVCQAGFVIRRRRRIVPATEHDEVQRVLQSVTKRRAQVAELERRHAVPPAAGGAPGAMAERYGTAIAQRRLRAAERLRREGERLEALLATAGVIEVVEGWVPGELDGVGSWQVVTDESLIDGTEKTERLSPIVVPADGPAHAARGRAMWFGMVPTTSGDHEPNGVPRFDDQHTYELRCFVRRHECSKPKRPGHPPDCCGELTFSEPSEPFRMAEHSDLVGTANRPVTIQLPNIPALLNHASTLEYGQGAPVRMAAPMGSSMVPSMKAGKPAGRMVKLAQICSISIPLITIVATFVIRLFLPIVVLAFGLWPLLRLRFCIVPEVSIDAAIDGYFAVTPAELNAKAAIDTKVDVGIKNQLELALGEDAATDMLAHRSRAEVVAYLHDLAHGPAGGVLEPSSASGDTGSAAATPGAPGTESIGPNSALAPLFWEREVKLV